MLIHLIELRHRTLCTLIWFGVLFLLFFFYANELFAALMHPLVKILPNHEGLIATRITAPVLTPLKLAGNAAMLFSAPCALYHLWRFMSPGLYQQEQKLLRSTLVLSFILFLAGVLFCYYLILPFMFQFFFHSLPKDVLFMPDMTNAMDFITRMLLLFGLCFQVPLICRVLVRSKIVDIMLLKKIRPYIIVSAFTIGMLLTPPDVLSQIMLALPLCVLYELGIIFAVFL